MSKFHVGDKVVWPIGQNGNGEEGLVVKELANCFPSKTGPHYRVDFGRQGTWCVAESELRPANIVALPAKAFTEGPDEAPRLKALVENRRAVDVTNPAHYRRFPVEVIEITEQLDFNKGNAVKYLCRAGYKDGVDEMEDLSKALWYVNRAIEKLNKERADG
jgi:hypothetical protein